MLYSRVIKAGRRIARNAARKINKGGSLKNLMSEGQLVLMKQSLALTLLQDKIAQYRSCWRDIVYTGKIDIDRYSTGARKSGEFSFSCKISRVGENIVSYGPSARMTDWIAT